MGFRVKLLGLDSEVYSNRSISDGQSEAGRNIDAEFCRIPAKGESPEHHEKQACSYAESKDCQFSSYDFG